MDQNQIKHQKLNPSSKYNNKSKTLLVVNLTQVYIYICIYKYNINVFTHFPQ